MQSFSAHNLMAVLMSGQPPKCRENISIYIKTSVYTSYNMYSSRKLAATQEAYVLEANVQRLGSSNPVRELANEASF